LGMLIGKFELNQETHLAWAWLELYLTPRRYNLKMEITAFFIISLSKVKSAFEPSGPSGRRLSPVSLSTTLKIVAFRPEHSRPEHIQTSLNSCDRSQRQWFSHVTRGDLLQQPVAATCRSDLSHSVSRPWGQDGWILAKFFFCVFMNRDRLAKFFFCVFMDWDGVEVYEQQQQQQQQRGQYPAILTKQAWSMKDLLYGKNTIFLQDTARNPKQAR